LLPRHHPRRPSRLFTAGLLLWALVALLHPSEARAGNGRLLSTDEAAAIQHPVLGLQRSAVPLVWGFALDTSLLADLALAPNLGLRWGLEAGPHRFVVGARYTRFLGAQIVSDFVQSQQPAVTRFEPSFSGPSAYALYGLKLGPVLVQAEARHALYEITTTTFTGAVVFNFAGNWSLLGELGFRLRRNDADTGNPLRGAAGLRYAGDNFGLSLGVAYVDLREPMLPVNEGSIPFIPAFDLSWTFR
jgi:hypothetical protein